jgi:hypothetical protein
VGALKLYKRENNTSVKGALGLYVGFKKGCAGAYRYGFNGQEKVDEIAGVGNHNTALFWEYDTRLGRRWNVDPVDKEKVSGFSCLSNNPISKTDILGDDDVFVNKDKSVDIVKTQDKFDRKFVDGIQEGQNLEKGWGLKNFSNARIINIGKDWESKYLFQGKKIIGLVAFKSGLYFNNGKNFNDDKAVAGMNIDIGIFSFEKSNDFAFYQTFYCNYNPQNGENDEKPAGNYQDGTPPNNTYPDSRVNLFSANKTGYSFDFYMSDYPNRYDYSPKNMRWNGFTTILCKSSDKKISNLFTLNWGFTVNNSLVKRQLAKPVKSGDDFHLKTMPKLNAEIKPTK